MRWNNKMGQAVDEPWAAEGGGPYKDTMAPAPPFGSQCTWLGGSM